MVKGLSCDQGCVEVGAGWSLCVKGQVEPQAVTLADPLCNAAGETRLAFLELSLSFSCSCSDSRAGGFSVDSGKSRRSRMPTKRS
jgi:hypothetical protein